MTLRPHVNPEAEEDLTTAALWYTDQDPERDLDAELLQEFTEVLERVCENPAIFPVYDGSVRRALLRRFPYGIFYEVEPDRVVVLAFVHMKREPDSWKR
jgi:plasmid stabilization system protein ParE